MDWIDTDTDVRMEIQLLHNRQHLGFGLLADLALPVHDIGDRRDGYAGGFRHIIDRCFH